ncbi:hypothetical protein, partial [Porphyromonas levii]|uniref:hypothetical protein n=1 Tax=Porphyromonas levii TaxID=28114 RepID=UPI001B8C4990
MPRLRAKPEAVGGCLYKTFFSPPSSVSLSAACRRQRYRGRREKGGEEREFLATTPSLVASLLVS